MSIGVLVNHLMNNSLIFIEHCFLPIQKHELGSKTRRSIETNTYRAIFGIIFGHERKIALVSTVSAQQTVKHCILSSASYTSVVP